MDDKDVIVEIKAGEGGQESMLFAGDLLRMYLRYAERQGWKTEILESTESDLGGYKDVSVAVKGRDTAAGEGVWARLKYEGGVHRVQRVPVTESQGRIHTSAAGVLVLPEAEDVEVEINPNDLRIDVFRSSGPGGQSVNTTDSAVRITHLPTGIVVSCQNEKSQLQNKESAMRILRARLLAVAQEEADKEASDAAQSQVRTVDRSERIRTYNFPENRISDHRIGFKAYNLDQVLDGDLDAVIQSCVDADTAAKLAAGGTEAAVTDPAADPPRWHGYRDGRQAAGYATPQRGRCPCCSPRSRRPRCASPRPASARPGTTPRNWPPGCTACAAPSCTASPTTTSTRGTGRSSRAGPTASRCSTSPARAFFRYLELAVGPGVFVPRPETEVMVGWAIDRLRDLDVAEPLIVDLCTGSGAIALSIAQEVPRARVHAVELSEDALRLGRPQHSGRSPGGG